MAGIPSWSCVEQPSPGWLGGCMSQVAHTRYMRDKNHLAKKCCTPCDKRSLFSLVSEFLVVWLGRREPNAE